jgi:Na+/melibiose symporter-like transporter
MTQRRSKIPMLGVIFFSIIIIGSAINGKPGMLISILATALILFCIHIIRKKMPDKREVVPPTEEETLFETARQQSHIQLTAIIVPLLLIGGAINGSPSVMITIIIILLVLFAFFSLKKRSPEQKAIYSQEKKILFKSFVFGLIFAAVTFYFNLGK